MAGMPLSGCRCLIDTYWRKMRENGTIPCSRDAEYLICKESMHSSMYRHVNGHSEFYAMDVSSFDSV